MGGTFLSKANLFAEDKEVVFDRIQEHLSEIQKGATQPSTLYPLLSTFPQPAAIFVVNIVYIQSYDSLAPDGRIFVDRHT